MTVLASLDATAGDMLAPVRFGPISRTLLALYAGASGDHNPVHIDIDMARDAGLDDVFAHGMLSFGVLARVVTRWAGIERLCEFSARFVSITDVKDELTCTGVVLERFDQDGVALARLQLSARTADGRETLSGEALVQLGGANV